MNENLTIETERLILRRWKLTDADDLVEGLNNINVSKWQSHTPYPYTKDDAIAFINKAIDTKAYFFAVVYKENNKVIGGVQIRNIDLEQGTASGGIWINEDYQGIGIGKETWGARIKYAFEYLNLRRLENGFFEGNERSFKMQEYFGYKLEGVRRQKYKSLATGKISDECVTGLLRSEWLHQDYPSIIVNEK